MLSVRMLAAVAALLAPPLGAMHGQSPRPTRTPPPDSTAWRPIMTYVVASLAPHIYRAAVDTTSQPWRMTFPDGGLAWREVEAQLRAALRGRDVTPQDSIYYELDVGPLRVINDTAHVELRSGMTRRCRGTSQTAGYGNIERVLAVRHESRGLYFWGPGRGSSVIHGDRAGCPR